MEQNRERTENFVDIEDVFQKIDRLFEENRAKEAGEYMRTEYDYALKRGDIGMAYQLLNELLGYYRQVSDAEMVQKTIGLIVSTAERMNLRGTVPYATGLINCANADRAIGAYEEAAAFYKEAMGIYEEQVDSGNPLWASLYNNYSLLQQELSQFSLAKEYLLKALPIVLDADLGFEIAVTYGNLANTCVALKEYREAEGYALEAMKRFRERGTIDAHYSSALSALGMCRYHAGDVKKATECFREGMEIVKSFFGENAQYKRLEENLKMCEAIWNRDAESQGAGWEKGRDAQDGAKGLAICKRYYEAFGAPMIHKNFPEYESRIAVGLLGKGSDCFGYDDATSRDHDWGPGFLMWVTRDTYVAIGEALEEAYNALPAEFEGFGRGTRVSKSKRRGVVILEDFFENLLEIPVSSLSEIDVDNPLIPEYGLAAAVNGEVFRDDEGILTALRTRLKAGYGESMRYRKFAEDVARFSQTGQYNYHRMLSRGDVMTADLMLAHFLEQAMRLYHHICGAYVPHDKWLVRSTKELPGGTELLEHLETLRRGLGDNRTVESDGAWEDMESKKTLEQIEELGAFLAMELYRAGYISDIDPYLDHHVEELLCKADLAAMKEDDLINAIVKLEFKAFDQVQNEGGRASCQNNWPTFYVMRKSQYLTWTREMLLQYYYDFERELRNGHNLITEKYGRMEESTAPDRFATLQAQFPEYFAPLSPEKKTIIEQVVAVQMEMADAFAEKYPTLADNARSLHSYEDHFNNTSYETYLRGEISTYSDKMLQLYAGYVIDRYRGGINIMQETIENTAKLYGFASLTEMAEKAR